MILQISILRNIAQGVVCFKLGHLISAFVSDVISALKKFRRC